MGAVHKQFDPVNDLTVFMVEARCPPGTMRRRFMIFIMKVLDEKCSPGSVIIRTESS